MAAEDHSTSPHRVGKSPSAFRTISEVSEELDVPQHVLRFWESKFSQVRPLKRGGGRRYYRPEDIKLLRRIRELLYRDGYTIKGVQRLIREGGVKAVVAGAPATPAPAPDPVPAPASAPGAPAERAEPARPAGDGALSARQRAALEEVLKELCDLRALLEGKRGARR